MSVFSVSILAILGMCSAHLQVVLDTDIGMDMDDTWALSYILASPHIFDLQLVVTASGDTAKRAQVAAKLLTLSKRTDVSIGVGVPSQIRWMRIYQDHWAADLPLAKYPGRVDHDGVALMADILSRSSEPTVIAIGPFTNLAALARRFPAVARRTRVYAMGGSIHKGYENASGPVAEYNIHTAVSAAQFALQPNKFSSWYMTPLDSCGMIELLGPRYHMLLASKQRPAVLEALLGSYRSWFSECSSDTHLPGCSGPLGRPYNPRSILWDVLPVISLAWQVASQRRPEDVLHIVAMKLCVTDAGLTVEQQTGSSPCVRVSVALSWLPGGLNAVKDDLVRQLLNATAWRRELESTFGINGADATGLIV
eukprot:CAMPEP_0180556580 /NCGR_PEP_ID=MMETSP1037_2-20121125/671_1 /TAXON_ID=632150 /ORGANISM="Azadinium spinosum, Strain 3D9" /LENGTH=365 /DNA_ID=CAMNT_0022572659 /DNA_START=41 /DNA_END=1138 /DNA_ORIENTATION=-